MVLSAQNPAAKPHFSRRKPLQWPQVPQHLVPPPTTVSHPPHNPPWPLSVPQTQQARLDPCTFLLSGTFLPGFPHGSLLISSQTCLKCQCLSEVTSDHSVYNHWAFPTCLLIFLPVLSPLTHCRLYVSAFIICFPYWIASATGAVLLVCFDHSCILNL